MQQRTAHAAHARIASVCVRPACVPCVPCATRARRRSPHTFAAACDYEKFLVAGLTVLRMGGDVGAVNEHQPCTKSDKLLW